MRVAVIGGGSWGTTLGSLVATKADVTMWALEPEVAHHIVHEHSNPVYLPGYELHPSLNATTSLEEALDGAEIIVSAVPAQYLRGVIEKAEPYIGSATPLVSLTKGIEQGTWKRATQVLMEVLDRHDRSLVGVLSGPNIAREVAAGQPAATVVAMPDPVAARLVQETTMTDRFRVYTNPDVVGCEIGGAVKNVLAIGAGIADGLGFGTTPKAALVTRGLAELARLGLRYGGSPLTFLGLAGNGDLVVSCTSPLSRNHHVGERLGRGVGLEQILNEMTMVAEGVKSAPGVLELARRAEVSMPICEQVADVLGGERTPEEAVHLLMTRPPTSELHGIG